MAEKTLTGQVTALSDAIGASFRDLQQILDQLVASHGELDGSPAASDHIHLTQSGETLEWICFSHYGVHGLIEEVLSLNTDLHPEITDPILPSGLSVFLPAYGSIMTFVEAINELDDAIHALLAAALAQGAVIGLGQINDREPRWDAIYSSAKLLGEITGAIAAVQDQITGGAAALNTFAKLEIHLAAHPDFSGILSDLAGAVRVVTQSLSEDQKAQARQNLDAVSGDRLGQVDAKLGPVENLSPVHRFQNHLNQ